jgi:uncharacterized membrane protein
MVYNHHSLKGITMVYGLTQLGVWHTAISLIALVAGFVAFFKYKEISWQNTVGQVYVAATAIVCLTGFGIFQHGGFGKPHVLGIITLIALAVAATAELTAVFGKASRYIKTVAYSATFLFHWIPAVTETSTRLPLGAPLLANAEAPELKAATGVLLVLFLVGTGLQIRRLRKA